MKSFEITFAALGTIWFVGTDMAIYAHMISTGRPSLADHSSCHKRQGFNLLSVDCGVVVVLRHTVNSIFWYRHSPKGMLFEPFGYIRTTYLTRVHKMAFARKEIIVTEFLLLSFAFFQFG